MKNPAPSDQMETTSRFLFWFGWALFIVFEKVTQKMPWPAKYFLISQFADEFEAQHQMLRFVRV